MVGGCLAERQLVDQRLGKAVRERCIVRFVCGRKHHEVEPHAYGIQADGTVVLFAYQKSFDAGGGGLGAWDTFRVDDIHGLVLTSRSFGGARPAVDCPISVAFAMSDALARHRPSVSVAGASPEAIETLTRQVDEAVQQLRLAQLPRVGLEGLLAEDAVGQHEQDGNPLSDVVG